MPVYEFKAKPNHFQCAAIDEAIRVAQFIRNKCLRLWMDKEKVGKYDLNKYCAVLANEFSFAGKLNSMARQASAERVWSAIARFYDRLARCVVMSNDLVAYEDLQVRNMVKNHCLAKSIGDAGWYQFRKWLEYFGQKFGKATIAVPPHYTSQTCSSCGAIVQKSLSTRTHRCACGAELDRDENAAINILQIGLRTVGHTGMWLLDSRNAWGEMTATLAEATQSEQVAS